MRDIIETFNLTKRFRQSRRYRELLMHPFTKKEITALSDITVSIRKGEIFGLLGPNGAGKTTLIKVFCTLILPDEGKVMVNGYDVTKNGREVRKSIGYVISEERSFYWRLTGRQNLQFFAAINNLTAAESKKVIDEMIELVGLKNDIDNVFQNYSSGMKQKLAVARGLLTDPQILFMDEPTRNLDPMTADNVRNFIKHVIVEEKKRTVILATNNMNEAEDLCDRVAIIYKGEAKKCESLQNIRNMIGYRSRYILSLRVSEKYLVKVIRNSGYDDKAVDLSPDRSARNDGNRFILTMDASRENIPDIVDVLVRSGIKIESCYPEEIPFHEIFKQIIE